MERLWLTDCAYLLTKPDHWFCPQRCAVLDGETRQGLPAEERAGCIPLPYVEIETLHRAFFDRKADGLLRRQYLRILRTSADRDAAIDAVGRMLEEQNLTGEYAAFERQFLLDAAQVWCRENGSDCSHIVQSCGRIVHNFVFKNFDYPEKPLKYKHIRRISD